MIKGKSFVNQEYLELFINFYFLNRLITGAFMSKKDFSKTAVKTSRTKMYDYDAHSPMFRNRNVSEEKRSRLFEDAPFIYGRLPKLLLAWMFCMNLCSGYYIFHKHSTASH